METKLLIIDDSPETVETLGILYDLNLPDCTITSANDSKHAWELLLKSHFDIISIDIQLGREDGIDLCREIREKFMDVFIIICSMDGSDETRERAVNSGASFFLPKPLSSDDVAAMFDVYLQNHQEPEVPNSSILEDLLRMADE